MNRGPWDQKAPSTRRRIKTCLAFIRKCLEDESEITRHQKVNQDRRKYRHDHLAPSHRKAPSTKRCIMTLACSDRACRRSGQKAPNTRRCIKTTSGRPSRWCPRVRKHPAPEDALRQVLHEVPLLSPWSESTQHQKVHEGIYRRAPAHRMPIFTLVRQNLDILFSEFLHVPALERPQ